MTRRQVQVRIAQWVAVWRPILGLDGWRIELRWTEREHVATCRALPEYEDAVIAFNLKAIGTDATDAWLEELVVHELVHCVAWKSNERTVTRISRAFLRLAGRPNR